MLFSKYILQIDVSWCTTHTLLAQNPPRRSPLHPTRLLAVIVVIYPTINAASR